MDRLRQRAGIKDGEDPWGQPLGSATRSRMAGVDVFTLSTQLRYMYRTRARKLPLLRLLCLLLWLQLQLCS
jgi:hypothetical protein